MGVANLRKATTPSAKLEVVGDNAPTYVDALTREGSTQIWNLKTILK